jgi:hypothetical protein
VCCKRPGPLCPISSTWEFGSGATAFWSSCKQNFCRHVCAESSGNHRFQSVNSFDREAQTTSQRVGLSRTVAAVGSREVGWRFSETWWNGGVVPRCRSFPSCWDSGLFLFFDKLYSGPFGRGLQPSWLQCLPESQRVVQIQEEMGPPKSTKFRLSQKTKY